jgi:AcrR family transcriptional regulator
MHRRPRQSRAKETVDAIVEATAQVFGARGYEQTTTARIAARAGVSVGSLYQYFPDKQALITAFVARRLAEDVELLERVSARAAGLPPLEALRVAIDEIVALFRRDRLMYQGVSDLLPLLEQTPEIRAGLTQAHAAAVMMLSAQPSLLRGRDPALVALLALHTVRGSLFRILEFSPEKLDDPDLPDLLLGLVTGLVAPPTGAEGPAAGP